MPKFVSTVAVAAMVALSLAACGASADDSALAACEETPSGPHSSSIKVSGEFGNEPTVKMPPAFEVKETERTVTIAGKGAPALDGELVTAHYTAYNAATGQVVQLEPESTWTEGGFLLDESAKSGLPGIYKTLRCAQEGARIVSAIPAIELFGDVDASEIGIGPADTVVFVFDVSKVEPAPTEAPAPEQEPLPTPSEWVDNVPAVDLSGDIPVVTLPDTAPPTELQLKVITEGTGPVVADPQSSVTVDYQGTSWDAGEIFDQSYTRGEPSTFPVGGVIEGFAAAMVDQKVGSTVIVTIPPEFAYGDDPSGHELGGQTLVFLIQIHDVE